MDWQCYSDHLFSAIQTIQTITDYKPPPQACDEDTSLPDALNHFYSRFEMQNDTPAQKLPTPPNDRALCLSPADVRKTLSRINPRKAAGPDNIPGRVLKDCAAQLTDVLTDIFNTSLSQAVVPTCLKSTTIIPVPKKSPVSCLNDYRPIALTPIMMKCFERLVMHNIKNSLPNTLDPLQFAYRPNRSTDDAISSTLHLALTHLENKDSYVRMLFIDFSSAFNTIIPQQLINKLNLLGLNNSLCNWILDFLTGRPQSVRVGHKHLEHYHTEHRCPTRLCAQPAALHAADPRLHCQVQLQPHHQVCWWHNSGRSHQQQRWNALQRGSGTAGWVVWR